MLYNKTNSSISLSGYYLGRDSGCSISSGFSSSNFKSLSGTIAAKGYFLIARSGNTINADSTQLGSVTTNYCIVLTNSSTKPTSATASNIIDFVGFGSSPVYEGMGPAQGLSDRKILRRNGSCYETDTNNNGNDFTIMDATSGITTKRSGETCG